MIGIDYLIDRVRMPHRPPQVRAPDGRIGDLRAYESTGVGDFAAVDLGRGWDEWFPADEVTLVGSNRGGLAVIA